MPKLSLLYTALGLFILISMLSFKQEEPADGKALYKEYCQSCHMKKGKGFFNLYPPLKNADWIGNDEKMIHTILNGLKGEITVDGKTYDKEMPSLDYLKDEQIAAIINYIRTDFAGVKKEVSPEKVKTLR